MWTAASARGFQIGDIVRWMCEKPAELAGLSSRKGRIAPGYDADFVVFDPDARFEATPIACISAILSRLMSANI